jgi:hypothetical protein
MRFIFPFFPFMVLCKACNKEFKNDHGLKRHRPACRLAKVQTSSLLRKRSQLKKNNEKDDLSRQDNVAGPSLNRLVETETVGFLKIPQVTSVDKLVRGSADGYQ